MRRPANWSIGLVGLIQALIGLVEMFFWTRPTVHGRLEPTIVLSQLEAEKVAPIVANAGLYNLFLAAGLFGSLLLPRDSAAVKGFLLGCVAIAGAYGAVTLKPTTLVLQTLPALVALVLVWSKRSA